MTEQAPKKRRPIHSAYHPGRDRVRTTIEGPSLTQASFQDECDINNVMKRFEKTGVLTHENQAKPQFGDFSGYADYHESMNRILAAQDAFMQIPATIRAQFHNDPGEFLEFAENPENIDELVEMGLAEPKPTSQEPAEAPPSTEGPPTPPPATEPTPPPASEPPA